MPIVLILHHFPSPGEQRLRFCPQCDTLSTAQIAHTAWCNLSAIKTTRDIMRKDAGLNTDVDRIQAEMDALLPSVLDRAFRGKL